MGELDNHMQKNEVDPYLMLYKNLLKMTLAGVAQWIEHWPMNQAQWIGHWPMNQRVASSIPSQGTCQCCGLGPC